MFRGVIHLFGHTYDLIRIFMLISITCFAPRFFITSQKESMHVVYAINPAEQLRLGIEQLQLRDLCYACSDTYPERIGLITNPKAIDQSGALNTLLLKEKGIDLHKIFYPQGMHAACVDELNEKTYFIDKQGFTHEMLSDIDLLLIDLPDAEREPAQRLSFLFEAIHAAAVYDIAVIVLDRPNGMGPKIEGSLSYLAQLPIKIPLRHGMTIAELAQYYNKQILNGNAKLHVVPMQGYQRVLPVEHEEGSVKPTLSLQDYGYMLCRIFAELSPFDVGLDTEYAYSCLALPQSIKFPEQRWYQLQIMLKHMGIRSTICKHYSSRKKEICKGLKLHIADIQDIDTFRLTMLLLEYFKRSGLIFAFSDYFDFAIGTPLVRQYIQGRVSKKVLCTTLNTELEHFYRKAFAAFIYHPLPQIALL